MPTEELSPLQRASSYYDAPVELPPLPESPVDPSIKWNAFAAGALKPTSSGRFGESLSNALGAMTDVQQRDAELQARYIPLLHDAKLRRSQAQAEMQARQQQQLQVWGTSMLGGLSSVLVNKAEISDQDVMHVARAAVQQGRVPAQFAQEFIKNLPPDPVERAAYIRQAAIAANDPFRAIEKPKFEKLGADETMVEIGPNGVKKTSIVGPGKPTDLARLQAERNALPPEDPRRAEYDAAILKATTHQPSHSIHNSFVPPPERPLVSEFMSKFGESMNAARDAAVAASSTVNTAHRLRDALGSKKVMAGPGTKALMVLGQVGDVMGINGKDTNEKITNTRSAISSLAQLELDASAQLKGQGAVTESERAILKRAASGDIGEMTVRELNVLAEIVERRARTRIKSYNTQGKRLLQMTDPKGNKIFERMPEGFVTVEEPPEYGGKPVLRFDAEGKPVQE